MYQYKSIGVTTAFMAALGTSLAAYASLAKYDDFQNEPASHSSLWTNVITGAQPVVSVGSTGSDQYVILDNSAVGSSTSTKAISLVLGSAQTVYDLGNTIIHITYDYYYNDNTANSYYAGLAIGGSSSWLTVRTRSDNNTTYGGRIMVDGHGTASGSTWGGSVKLSSDKWYHVDLTVDTSTGKVALYTWDRNAAGKPMTPEDYTVGSTGYLYSISTTISNVDWAHSSVYWYNENGLFDTAGAASQNRGQYMIDNVYTDLVPEPTSLLLMGLGGMALLWRKK